MIALTNLQYGQSFVFNIDHRSRVNIQKKEIDQNRDHNIDPSLFTFFQYTFCVEVVPVCKDNLVCLPPRVAHGLGGIGQESIL
jgi:nonsense-mediated mRNA decay protein 3